MKNKNMKNLFKLVDEYYSPKINLNKNSNELLRLMNKDDFVKKYCAMLLFEKIHFAVQESEGA